MNKYFVELLTAAVVVTIGLLLIRLYASESAKSAVAGAALDRGEAEHAADIEIVSGSTVGDVVDELSGGSV
jgi:hypothetical protein